jgi:antitoxin (DNA-binding transcriptional repressor) of toxin-antitoxin stability system
MSTEKFDAELLRRIEAGERIPFSERRPAARVSPLAYEPDEETVDESDLPTVVRRSP